jgi:hypothetical protein
VQRARNLIVAAPAHIARVVPQVVQNLQ